MTLWLAAAGLGVVALGLVIVAGRGGGGDDADLPTLRIGADAGAAAGAADSRAPVSEASDDMSILPAGTYVPGEGLPKLGGEAPVYRLDAAPDRASVQRLADALGIDGEPTETDGSWHIEDGELGLDVYGVERGWSIYPTAWTDPVAGDDTAAPDGSEPARTAEELCPTVDPVPADSGSGTGAGSAGSTGNAGADDLDILKCEPPLEPVRPENLPSSDEARTIALDLLKSTGADVDGAKVTVDDGITEWFVSVEPRVGGLRAPGLTMYVGVGDEGRIVSASGYLATPEKLGDYPLLDTTAALERLNEDRVYLGPAVDLGAADAREPAVDTPAVAPDPAVAQEPAVEPNSTTTVAGRDPGDDLPVLTPPVEPPDTALPPDVEPMPEPTLPPDITIEPPPPNITEPEMTVPETTVPEAPPDVAVTDAEIVLVWESSWDGSGTYLVPGYQFTAEDGSDPTVDAVEEDLLEPPPTEPPAEPGQVEPANPALPPAPDPDEPVSSPGSPEG